jgi:hypothetical protein
MPNSFRTTTFAAAILSASLCVPALSAAPIAGFSEAAIHSDVDQFSARARGGGGGGRGGGMHAGGGGGRVHAGGPPRANVNVNRRGNVNVNVNRRTNVVVAGRRPVRGWAHRPYYGTVIGGIALGTLIGVAAGAVPVAPAPNMCWYWADSGYNQGYWDYCVQP